MAFDWLSAGLGGAGVLSGIFGGIQQNKIIDKQIKAQREEAQISRDWNSAQADKARRWSREQWDAQNEYNLPSNTIQRMRDANLNPNLMYGNPSAASMGVSGSTAQGVGSPSTIPTDVSALGQKRSLGGMFGTSLSNLATVASIKNMDATTANINEDTKKKDAETKEVLTRTSYIDDLSKSTVSLNNSTIMLNAASASWQNQNVNESYARVRQIDQSISESVSRVDNILASTSNLDANTIKTQIESYWYGKDAQAHIKQMQAQTELSYTQASDLLATQVQRILQLKGATSAANAVAELMSEKAETEGVNRIKITSENNRLVYDLTQDQKFQDYERTINMVEKGVSTGNELIQGISSALNLAPRMRPSRSSK